MGLEKAAGVSAIFEGEKLSRARAGVEVGAGKLGNSHERGTDLAVRLCRRIVARRFRGGYVCCFPALRTHQVTVVSIVA